jgi:hypothetical protein
MNEETSASLTPEELRRYDNRTGFDLVNCQAVGLPVYKITIQALTQVRKPIPPIEEFVLKAIDIGLSSAENIAGFLGLETEIIRDAMINLRISEDIDLIAPDGSQMQAWQLTKKGVLTLRDAKIIVPEERSFDINFDGMLRYPRWYGRLESSLLKDKNWREQGLLEINPLPNKRPEISDIKLKEVDEIIRQIESKSKGRHNRANQNRDLIALKAIERRSRFFQPALALIYKAKDSDDVQVAFAIDGKISTEHEAAFARSNGVKKLRIIETIKESAPRKLAVEVLGHEFVAQAPLKEVEELKEKVSSSLAQIDTVKNSVNQAEDDESRAILEQQIVEQQRQIELLKSQLNSVPMRWLEMYEHRPLLEDALQKSQQRLLIISPWIRANSIDKKFLQKFENLLQRGVQVFIGYGLGKDDNDKKYQNDIQAEQKIQKLAQQYQKNFKFQRLGDTHAKILISDTKFAVTTSFNWLSFKGEPNRTFRDERGTLVSDVQKINELFDSYKARFGE